VRELEIVSDIEQIPSRPPRNISLREGITPRDAMPHKFAVGQAVHLHPHNAAHQHSLTSANYVVTQQLPERDGVFEYSVMSPTEPYERVFIESELRAVEGGSSRPSGKLGRNP
jgi:hypothetical protein